MEKALNLLRGCVRCEVSGARPQQFLNLCARRGVEFWDAEHVDDYTIRLTARVSAEKKLADIAARAMCELTPLGEKGAPKHLRRVKKRIALLAGAAICLAAIGFSSLFVWDIEVTGCVSVTEGEVLRVLDESGVGIGSFWPVFISDNIRSRVLVRLPALKWITVNVYGSRAEVIVRERTPRPEIVAEDVPADVTASRAGLITSVSTLRGSPLVSAGQTVLEGDTLVTGIVGSGYSGVRFEHAMAQVRARTWYDFTLVTPIIWSGKAYTGEDEARYSFICAGREIIFSSDYGIIYDNCDKIIIARALEADGLFDLPLGFTERRSALYTPEPFSVDIAAETERLTGSAMARLRAMIGADGEVISTEIDASESGGLLSVRLRAECEQDIASLRELTQEEMDAARASGEDEIQE